MVRLGNALQLTSVVRDLGIQSGTCLKAYQVALDHIAVAEKTVGPKGDLAGIYGAVRLESGLKYENCVSPEVILSKDTERDASSGH